MLLKQLLEYILYHYSSAGISGCVFCQLFQSHVHVSEQKTAKNKHVQPGL